MADPAPALDVPLRADILLLANAARGFFAKLAKRRLERGLFQSVVALEQAIKTFVDAHNQQPKPFQSRAKSEDIIAAAKSGHQTQRRSTRRSP